MNGPHVQALIYRVEHAEGVDFEQAEPLKFETSQFAVEVKDGTARFALKQHYMSVSEAWDSYRALYDNPAMDNSPPSLFEGSAPADDSSKDDSEDDCANLPAGGDAFPSSLFAGPLKDKSEWPAPPDWLMGPARREANAVVAGALICPHFTSASSGSRFYTTADLPRELDESKKERNGLSAMLLRVHSGASSYPLCEGM